MSSLDKIVKEEIDIFFSQKEAGLSQLNEFGPKGDLKKKVENQIEKLNTKIKAFADYIYSKYGVGNQTLSSIVKSAQGELAIPQVAQRFPMTEQEFHMFTQYYTHMLAKNGQLGGHQVGENNFSVHFGGVTYPGVQAKAIDAGKGNEEVVAKIHKMAQTNRANRFFVSQQSQLYEASDVQNTEFDKTRDNIGCAIHPVLAAMFRLRVDVLDNRFLASDIAQLVSDRLNGAPIRNRADFELFVDLCNDKNESICSQNDVFSDMHRRGHVQNMLRNAVLNMRQGLFFRCDSNSFLLSIDQCKQSPFDFPHLVYSQDESVILSRLLNVFSFRPTVLALQSVMLAQNVPVPAAVLSQVPIIACNIPTPKSVEILQQLKTRPVVPPRDGDNLFNISIFPRENDPSSNNYTFSVVGGVVQPVRQSIMYTRDVLFIYVNRRMRGVSAYGREFLFSRMPGPMVGLRKINNIEVDVPLLIQKNGDTVWVNKPSPTKKNVKQPFLNGKDYGLVSTVCVRPKARDTKGEFEGGCFTVDGDFNVYDPIGLRNNHEDVTFKPFLRDGSEPEIKLEDVITVTDSAKVVKPPIKDTEGNSDPDLLRNIVTTHGTIYMYVHVKKETNAQKAENRHPYRWGRHGGLLV